MSTKTAKGRQTASAKAKSGKKSRTPVKPVRVGKDRNWGPIVMFTVVGLIAAGIIGAAAWGVLTEKTWQERAAAIEGLVNYRETKPEMLTAEHVSGVLEYEVMPPVGGNHNDYWQNCNGMVYDAPIAKEHAVHSLEHGAVWVTLPPRSPERPGAVPGPEGGGDRLPVHEPVRGPGQSYLSAGLGLPAQGGRRLRPADRRVHPGAAPQRVGGAGCDLRQPELDHHDRHDPDGSSARDVSEADGALTDDCDADPR